MTSVGTVMRNMYAWFRSEEVKSPTFVVFFFYEPIIMTTDPENVKVRTTIYYTRTELCVISCFQISMQCVMYRVLLWSQNLKEAENS